VSALKKDDVIGDNLPDLELDEESRVATRPLLESLGDVPVRVSAVLGKTRIDVQSLLALDDGAVIELNRKVGEPIDIYVNDTLIARGELVIVDGSVGVTLTEIIGAAERS
jgi:flagellar motor switch protein FliN/FliY